MPASRVIDNYYQEADKFCQLAIYTKTLRLCSQHHPRTARAARLWRNEKLFSYLSLVSILTSIMARYLLKPEPTREWSKDLIPPVKTEQAPIGEAAYIRVVMLNCF